MRSKRDEVFGEIEFGRRLGIIGAGFWDGHVTFRPIQKRVKIRLTAGSNGPTQAQQEFYRELENRYYNLVNQIREILLDTPLNYFGPDFFGKLMPELDWKDFELDAIGIGKIQDAEHRWNLSFRYAPLNVTYSVNFEGWKPTHGELDE